MKRCPNSATHERVALNPGVQGLSSSMPQSSTQNSVAVGAGGGVGKKGTGEKGGGREEGQAGVRVGSGGSGWGGREEGHGGKGGLVVVVVVVVVAAAVVVVVVE